MNRRADGAARPRWRATKAGAALGAAAIVAWLATFDPHGGGEWSSWLFPLWSAAANALFAGQDTPVAAFHVGALLHWPLLGAVVDGGIAWRRRHRLDRPGRTGSTTPVG